MFCPKGCRVIVYSELHGQHSEAFELFNSRLRCLVVSLTHCSCGLGMQHSSRGTWRRWVVSMNAMGPRYSQLSVRKSQPSVSVDLCFLESFVLSLRNALSVIFAFLQPCRHLAFADLKGLVITGVARTWTVVRCVEYSRP